MPEDREPVGASARLSRLRPRRLLRPVAGRHATAHFHATRHPIIEGYDPPEGWGYCYVDDAWLDLGADVTPQDGPIPRFV